MPEGKGKKDQGVTVRVPEWLADALEKEQQSKARPRPTKGELLSVAWNAWKGNPTKQPKEPPELADVRDVLDSGHQVAISGLRGSLQVCIDLVRAVSGGHKRKAG